MSCETARHLIETNDPALEQHVRSCPSCLIQRNAPYYEAPPGLEQKILRSINRDRASSLPWRWAAIAAAVLLVFSGIWNVVLFNSRVDPRQVLAENLVSAHVRSLAGDHLLDVPSSDQHTVKPWFNGKLDFSPTVKDVNGFPLLGGRLEYIDGHSVAALVYARNKHVINLFTWPSSISGGTALQTRNGFHLLSWSGGGATFWAISDLNETELRQFVELYRMN
jgi:anti-sigma factor RsiW